MKDLNTIVSILNFAGLGGIGLFIYYLFKGLKERIANLSKLAEEQRQTLDVVRERAIEVDKLSKHYKQALEDFQDMGAKLESRRKELITELEDANKRKDDQLKKLKEIEIQEIELKTQSLSRIPELENQLQNTISQLRNQIEIITPKDSIDKLTKDWISIYKSYDHILPKKYFTFTKESNSNKTILNYFIYKRIFDTIKSESGNDLFLNDFYCYYFRNLKEDNDNKKDIDDHETELVE